MIRGHYMVLAIGLLALALLGMVGPAGAEMYDCGPGCRTTRPPDNAAAQQLAQARRKIAEANCGTWARLTASGKSAGDIRQAQRQQEALSSMPYQAGPSAPIGAGLAGLSGLFSQWARDGEAKKLYEACMVEYDSGSPPVKP